MEGMKTQPHVSAMAAAVVVRVLMIAAAFLVRGEDAFVAIDSLSYFIPAESLVEAMRFDGIFGGPEVFRTPGYPAVLVPGVLAGHPIVFALLVQLVAAVAIVALTYGIALDLVGERLAKWSALAVAIEPTLLIWSMKVMPETLLTLALVLFFVAAWRGRWIAAACALCAAAYLKPVAYPLVAIIFIVAGFRDGWRRAIVFLATCAALLAPWHLRNYSVARYAGFSSLTDQAIYFGLGGSVRTKQERVPYQTIRERMWKDVLSQPEGERYRTMRQKGLRLAATDPIASARTHVAGMVRTLVEPGAVEYLRMFGLYPEQGGALLRIADVGLARGAFELARTRPVAVWSSVLLMVFLLPLVVLPFAAWRRVDEKTRWPLVLCTVIAGWLVIAAGGVYGSSRFRAPAVPFMILMSAITLHSARGSDRSRSDARDRRDDRVRLRGVAADGTVASGETARR